jgi:tol-pal system protein YbgF
MHSTVRRLLAAVVLATALPAHAGLFSDDEARTQIAKLRADIDQLNKRIADLNQRADTMTGSQLDLANQLSSIVGDVAKLRGQLEVITYDLDSAQKRQKDFYVDLDNRVRKLEQTAAQQAEQQKAAAAAPATPAVPAVDPQAETHDYEAALNAFRAAKYKEAGSALGAFIKAYPNSSLQASAHYWAAAVLRQQGELGDAAKAFSGVAENWPDDPKASEALLAQADCEHEEREFKNERKILEKLVTRYPDSKAAQSAKARLKKK